MLRSLALAVSAAILLAGPAAADTAAMQLQADAARLLTQVNAARTTAAARPAQKPAPLSASLVTDLQRFGMNSSRLALDITARGGPQDLGCIFRGMAGETDAQLTAASSAATGKDMASALARLSHMLDDAVTITPAADKILAAPKAIAASPVGPAATATCPAVKP